MEFYISPQSGQFYMINVLENQWLSVTFNNALLQDKCFVGNVKKTIASLILKYAIPVYNFDKFQNIPVHDVQFTINDQQFFEQLLL